MLEKEEIISPALEDLKNHYRSIITLLGEDAEREGLLKTPERVAKAMFSAVVCASMVQGKSAAAGVEKACRFIERSLIDTVADQIPRNDGINFESHLSMLLD